MVASSNSKEEENEDNFFDHSYERGKKRSLTDDKKFQQANSLQSVKPTNNTS